MHNLSDYDAHLFVEDLHILNDKNRIKRKINVIAKTSEDYITFGMPIEVESKEDKETGEIKYFTRKLRFIDSFRFTDCSLSPLVKVLFATNSNYWVGSIVRTT